MNKVAMIKRYRALNDCSIRRAKDDCEDLIATMAIKDYSVEVFRDRDEIKHLTRTNEMQQERIAKLEMQIDTCIAILNRITNTPE